MEMEFFFASNFGCDRIFCFFPESERTGPPVGGRPHSTGPGGAGVREATAGGDGVR
jgi:hypothetical protein